MLRLVARLPVLIFHSIWTFPDFLPVLFKRHAPTRFGNSVDKIRHAFWAIFARFCPFFALQFFGNFVDKFINIQIQRIIIQIQTWLSDYRNEVRRFRRDCCPVSSPSEPPRPAKERGDDVSSPLSLESLPSSRHWRTSNRCVARSQHIRLSEKEPAPLA